MSLELILNCTCMAGHSGQNNHDTLVDAVLNMNNGFITIRSCAYYQLIIILLITWILNVPYSELWNAVGNQNSINAQYTCIIM